MIDRLGGSIGGHASNVPFPGGIAETRVRDGIACVGVGWFMRYIHHLS
jgi:hypothetical protein